MADMAEQMVRLDILRKMVDKAIECKWARGEPGKHYEGIWELRIKYPSTAEGGAKMPPCFWIIKLHCYLIGPDRHYEWCGKTFEEAITKCGKDVVIWCYEAKKEAEQDAIDD